MTPDPFINFAPNGVTSHGYELNSTTENYGR